MLTYLTTATLLMALGGSHPLESYVRLVVVTKRAHEIGAGVVVSGAEGRPYILTAAHVVARVRNGAGAKLQVTDGTLNWQKVRVGVAAADSELDLAVLNIVDTVYANRAAVALAPPSPNQFLASWGGPGGGAPVKRTHRLTMYYGSETIPLSSRSIFGYTGLETQGRSGGPVYNARGRLVGIISFADPAHKGGGAVSLHSRRAQRLLGKFGIVSDSAEQFVSNQTPSQADHPAIVVYTSRL